MSMKKRREKSRNECDLFKPIPGRCEGGEVVAKFQSYSFLDTEMSVGWSLVEKRAKKKKVQVAGRQEAMKNEK